ncbi:MAG: hypothetical protein CL470_03200 [Acidimicrobiaceae bacterium]|nr:hypothetical protein [Acidimicrobiaceae bacterium]|tara:strand:- start:1552 stop:2199 length:648 start_codon:yes stop_codon:yes gene_type:complete
MSGKNMLSEFESKNLLSDYGLRVTREAVVHSVEEAVSAATKLGFPVVLKITGSEFAHKTELNGVKLNLVDSSAVKFAADELFSLFDEPIPLLISEQIDSSREFLAGVTRTDDYGLTLAFGVGGIFAEELQDVAFRLLPASRQEIFSMYDDLSFSALLGPVRGESKVDLESLTGALLAISCCALEREDIRSIDVNPILISDGQPIAVDALVELYGS